MIVEVLGREGAETAALEAVVTGVVVDLGISGATSLRRIHDPALIIARGVRRWPGLAVNGTVVCRGRVPSAPEVRGYLEAAQRAGG